MPRKTERTKEQVEADQRDKLKKTCPPDLFKIIEKESNLERAARASGISKSTLTQVAKGVWPARPKVQTKIDAYLAGKPIHGRLLGKQPKQPRKIGGNLMPTPTPHDTEPPPIAIPPWDKKMATYKYQTNAGKKKSLKLPAELIELIKQHGGVLNSAGRATGYSGWNPVASAIESGKYGDKVHSRVYSALNGLPINTNGSGTYDVPDAFTLNIAVCLVSLNEYERLEDVADILGGTLVFKMSTGSAGWVVIYKLIGRDKLEKFKRLAKRDAKRIVCP